MDPLKNIHIYPSNFSNESRILRTAAAIESLGLFDEIDLVGIMGSESETTVSQKTKIRRFSRDSSTLSFLPPLKKIVSHVGWLHKVYSHYKNQDLSCINAHSLTVLPLCALLKFKTGAKLVYDTHELETKTAGSGKIRQLCSGLIERAFISYVDYTVVVSSCIKHWYEEKYKLHSIDVIYNCPIPIELEYNNVLRDELEIDDDNTIFLYQGVLSKGRGVELLIDAFSNLDAKRYSLVFMGYGPMEDYIISRSHAIKNVFFRDAVRPEDILRYTSSADVGLSVIEPISLSYEYCMPNKLFEYLNAGLPVITSPTKEQKLFVEENSIGLVSEDYNPESIEKVVVHLAKNIEKYMGSVKNASAIYNWHQESKKIESIYRQVLGM